MFVFFSRLLVSRRIKKTFDVLFDLAILLSIIRLAVVVLAGIFEPLLADHSIWFDTILNQKRAVAISLNTLILVKIYKVLHYFIGDHHIKLIDLIEIAITSIIIKMVFDLNYSREAIILLIVLLSFFLALNYAQKKNFLIEEDNSNTNPKPIQ